MNPYLHYFEVVLCRCRCSWLRLRVWNAWTSWRPHPSEAGLLRHLPFQFNWHCQQPSFDRCRILFDLRNSF